MMKGSTVELDQRGGVPILQLLPQNLSGIGGTLLTLHLPLFHEARLPQPQRKGVACIDKAMVQ